MSYQLRFSKSVPIHTWLKRTAALLEAIIPREAWPLPAMDSANKVRELKKALRRGLLSFVTRRSLCGTEAICDLGCVPAPENKSPDRFADCVVLGYTRQYLVEGVENLEEMAEKLTEAIVDQLPTMTFISDKIQEILRDTLSSHLYQNIHCGRVALCRHSEPMSMDRELS